MKDFLSVFYDGEKGVVQDARHDKAHDHGFGYAVHDGRLWRSKKIMEV